MLNASTYLPKLIALVIKTLNKTIRLKLINVKVLDQINKQKKSLIYAFWDGRQILMMGCRHAVNLAVMISPSRDGIFISNIVRHLNFYPVAGSSSRHAVKGLLGMISAINSGHNGSIAVDGPRGPIYKAKPGIVYLASKTNSVIIPVTSKAKCHYTFKKSWCKYELPLPFSPGVIIFGEPIEVPAEINKEIIEQKRIEIENSLQDITLKVDKFYLNNN